jgi:hypothetical protein
MADAGMFSTESKIRFEAAANTFSSWRSMWALPSSSMRAYTAGEDLPDPLDMGGARAHMRPSRPVPQPLQTVGAVPGAATCSTAAG